MNGCIEIRGARVHNLKNISLKIPRNKLVVITGVSGSGKSSLAFDTIYAEGQRRYVESLSSYARQFLGRMNKPEVDFISGIPPAIAIEQKIKSRNPRSTVGTSTEIYDYLRLLYGRIGRTVSPVSGKEVKKHSVDDIVEFLASLQEDSRVIITAAGQIPENINIGDYFSFLRKQGFDRIETGGKIIRISEINEDDFKNGQKINIVIDRLIIDHSPDNFSRAADSAQTAFHTGQGYCEVLILNDDGPPDREGFSTRFEADGIVFEEPSEYLFSFNNPLGACPLCEGYGRIIGIDEDLVIPDRNLSVYDDAIACWKGESMRRWKERLISSAHLFDFPVHKPYFQLSDEQKALLWKGNRYFYGLDRFFRYLEEKKYKIQYRVMLSRYRGKTVCPECRGSRLRKEAGYVKIAGKTIQELADMPANRLYDHFSEIKLDSPGEEMVAGRLLTEINTRLRFILDVGLSYLTLNRLSSTLSGGESQRINLSSSLGSNLVGSMYILDEPSIGLHPRDTALLVRVLRELRDLGNTVIVVEHEEEIIKAADHIIDLGPEAGRLGGEIVFQGSPAMAASGGSLTAGYLAGTMKIAVPSSRRKWNSFIEIVGARENNLKNIDVKFPLHTITAVTGVSGSGKSSLVTEILHKYLSNRITGSNLQPGQFREIRGDITGLTGIELIDQNPIGKSSRSNPVTYLKAYDEIRKLFAGQQASVQNNYKPSHFSFNIKGGRCEECQGEGIIRVEMQFMAPVELTCEECRGMRFKRDILEVKYHGKNIHDLLEMTIDEAIEFFSGHPGKTESKIVEKLKPLSEVGLGYIKMGQSSSTLSGGESQRVKLAYFLSQEKASGHILFIFDEPTTGLHFHDINKLLKSINALVEHGHSVVVIEHNPEIIKSCDWIIDLGPEGGNEGGYVVFEGKPEDLVNCAKSYTGKYLLHNLEKNSKAPLKTGHR
ncbi:MAG TPA: excinuclease ABC subunit UvrA [Bacteroidales bacterium]|jgi:excinuclease ABC subunit A|nr:excinuclease ABC subunit UvrA [Bacteroidales bacterium]HQH23610.1 excinuclease ABC subunit UvrA [Bacteroidales bacterium]HQJ81132.1 excinuclease ABC subunit UvrA [Bacteroidales bacterium]